MRFYLVMTANKKSNKHNFWHVARMGRREVCTGFWWGSLRERDHWGDPDVDGRIILSGRGLWGLDGAGPG
jgi:hypothetical protein